MSIWLDRALRHGSLIAAGEQQTLLQQLDGPMRAKVLAALAGLIILGFAMILLTWLGARATRRYMNMGSDRRRKRGGAPKADDWAKKPLAGRRERDSDHLPP